MRHSIYDLISFSCLQEKSCKAISAYKNTSSFLPPHREQGSPYHRKCYLLGGLPTFIEYKDEKIWKGKAICKFDDRSFISLFNKL